MPAAQLHIALPERYRVLRHVATGGMAAVYAACDELLDREVAVKVLSPALGRDEAARERFMREARAAARVSDHPHVVTIYDVGDTNEEPPSAFIVMELLTGGTVADHLRRREPIAHALALRWLAQAADALDAAHAAGMVHRDVKPANLLLDAKGALKVTDFGIATLATDSPLTQTGQVVGTATYFSPEQALGHPATAASDRYALAVVAYELLTGERPFPPGPPAAQALARVERDAPPPTSRAPGLPGAVDAVMARGLARDPGARLVSAAAFVADLEWALGPTATTGFARPAPLPETEVVRQRTPRPRRPAAAAAAAPRSARDAPPTPPPSPGPAVAASRGPSRAGLVAAAAALLLLAGAAVAAVLSGSGGSEPAGGLAGDARTATQRSAQTDRSRRRERTTRAPATSASGPPAATPAPAATSAAATAPADASGIQARAHQAILDGDYAGAIDGLRGLVGRCPVEVTAPCAYAWYDLGHALRLAGDPASAIPVLEHRLLNDNQAGTVRRELDAARAEASAGGDGGEHGGKGQDKGAKGKGKEKD